MGENTCKMNYFRIKEEKAGEERKTIISKKDRSRERVCSGTGLFKV